MLKSLKLRFGPNGHTDRLSIPTGAMTVFVGPNNAGKSLLLREINGCCRRGPSSGDLTLEDIELALPHPDEIEPLLRTRAPKLPTHQDIPPGHLAVCVTNPGRSSFPTINVDLRFVRQEIERIQHACSVGTRARPDQSLFSDIVAPFTVALDGKSRLSLTDEADLGDLQQSPHNHLAVLFQNDKLRDEVRTIVHTAFRKYFVLDPTNPGRVRIRLSERAPIDSAEEQGLDSRARSFHASAVSIEDQSDGVKAFVGLVSALIAADYRIITIDEPEAFLHPPLARRLGHLMATHACTSRAAMFTATHSSYFLMGCIESGSPTNAVRLTYDSGEPVARLLSSAEISQLMTDPLLRSTGVLSALFHRCAVICEADKDRAFYEEINLRLFNASHPAVSDGVFLNAQNKQTIQRIVRPLREMGVPAAAIVDIDILKHHKHNDLVSLMIACFVPAQEQTRLTVLQRRLFDRFSALHVDMKDGGVRHLQQHTDQAIFQDFISGLQAYGIFVVPLGEVENWLEALQVQARKQLWLPAIFQEMGSDPTNQDYVSPTGGDVWDFVGQIATWTDDPCRLGLP